MPEPCFGTARLPNPSEATAEVSVLWHPDCIFNKSDFESTLTARSFSVVICKELNINHGFGQLRGMSLHRVELFLLLNTR